MTAFPISFRRVILIVCGSLTLSVLFFAPRLWLMKVYVPGSFQWDRAHTFLQQCEQPLRRDIEPAMLWRVLPPLVAHALHLPGRTPLVLPWFGLLAATTYAAVLLRRRLDDTRFIFGGTLLFATTSAVLVPVGWLGMNDAWVWLGLLVVAYGRAKWSVPLACLLCPWVDERFIIGYPLAWLVARQERNEPIMGRPLLTTLWLLPYTAIRLLINRQDESADAFVHQQLTTSLQLLPLVPLGWWMGLRAAWAAVAYALWDFSRSRLAGTGLALLGTLGISVSLASDLSRSVAIATPLVLAGCFALARRHPAQAPRVLLILGVINLLIPAAHLTYVHIDPINPLPIELFRLLR
ncbi:MAG: hypothetical protein NTX39_12870 [Opitutae bacterium]|nr:hypothetical protein [Opitutae bacterium]